MGPGGQAQPFARLVQEEDRRSQPGLFVDDAAQRVETGFKRRAGRDQLEDLAFSIQKRSGVWRFERGLCRHLTPPLKSPYCTPYTHIVHDENGPLYLGALT